MKDNGFKIDTTPQKSTAINRTVRIQGDTYDKLMELSERYSLSFNKVVNQCLEYALSHLIEEE